MNNKLRIGLILLFILISVSVGIFLFLYKQKSSPNYPQNLNNLINQIKNSDCQNNPNPQFTHDITDVDKIRMIVPPGGIEEWDGNKILKTHSYVLTPTQVPVYAPVDSELYQGVYYLEEGQDQYSLFFEVSCEVFYLFDHIVKPVEAIKQAFPDPPVETAGPRPLASPIIFKAGDLIGYGGQAMMDPEQWDFGVYNSSRSNQAESADVPKLYSRDKIADCPYNYFPEEKKSAYYALFGNKLTGVPTPTLFCQP